MPASLGRHKLLGKWHYDALIADVVAGDLIFGNATPKWARLPKGTDGQYLALSAGLPVWTTPPAGAPHNLLSVTHPDTVIGTVARGDLITGQGAVTPLWTRLPIALAGRYLRSDGLDALWGQVDHAELINVLPDQHHVRLHALDSALDHSGVITDAQHGSRGAGLHADSHVRLHALSDVLDHSGILTGSMGGLQKALVPTWTNDYILVYKTATDDWRMEAKPAGAADPEKGKVGRFFNLLKVGRDYLSFADVPANRLYAIPFFLPRRMRFDSIGLYCRGAGAAGAQGRLGIYSDDGNLTPSSLVLDAGTIDLTTVGAKTIAINQTLDIGYVWLAYVGNDATVDLNNVVLTPVTGNTVPCERALLPYATYTYGTLPATFPAPTWGDSAPAIEMRLAEIL